MYTHAPHVPYRDVIQCLILGVPSGILSLALCWPSLDGSLYSFIYHFIQRFDYFLRAGCIVCEFAVHEEGAGS